MIDFSANDWEEHVENLKVDDILFTNVGPEDWLYNAWIDSEHVESTWIAMMLGYKQAADLLIQAVIQRQGTTDLLVYPILFLYRHHTELQLKLIIELGKDSIGENTERLRNEHNLMELWTIARKVIDDLFVDEQEDTNKIENILKQLGEIDPRSFSFRYSHDTKKMSAYFDNVTLSR